jgi:hypothetical protein
LDLLLLVGVEQRSEFRVITLGYTYGVVAVDLVTGKKEELCIYFRRKPKVFGRV